jgi:hypothetical protein
VTRFLSILLLLLCLLVSGCEDARNDSDDNRFGGFYGGVNGGGAISRDHGSQM